MTAVVSQPAGREPLWRRVAVPVIVGVPTGAAMIGQSDRSEAAVAAVLVGLVAWLACAGLGQRGSVAESLLLAVMVLAGSFAAATLGPLGFVPALAAIATVVTRVDRPLTHVAGALFLAMVTWALSLIATAASLENAGGCLVALALITLTAALRRQAQGAVEARQSLLEQRVATELARAKTVAWEERTRIARDLHDVLAHSLGGVVTQTDAIEAELQAGLITEARQRAARTHELAVAGLKEARAAVATLREPPTDLAEAVRDLVATHESLGGRAELSIAHVIDATPEVSRALSRSCQELLTNARRHSPGTVTTVALLSAGTGALQLTVTTPNTRQPPPEYSGGNGLRGIAERIEPLGGTVSIDCGDPFTVRVEVPA